MSGAPQVLYMADVFNPLPGGGIARFAKGALVVGTDGAVVFAGDSAEARSSYPHAQVYDYGRNILLPGMVDCHVHLPQYPVRALGRGELLDWLRDFVYPQEECFSDAEYARVNSERFFRDALALGTTTMAVYCSSHAAATDIAFQVAEALGIRVSMGKSIMERNAPASLLSSAEHNIRESMELARKWHNGAGGRLRYMLTPRYAGSCTSTLLRRVAEISAVEGLPVQTHLAENPAELQHIGTLFPEARHYTDVYCRTGLLSERLVAAHAIHLSEHELRQLEHSNTAIAHCPCSNRFLQSGLMPLQHYRRRPLRIGLGTDVAGGFSLSMFNEQREAIESSKTWNITHRTHAAPVLRPEEALWLATLGGAQALGLEQTIGNFASGKHADFIIVKRPYSAETATLDTAQTLATLIYPGEMTTVLASWVQGRRCFGPGEAIALRIQI